MLAFIVTASTNSSSPFSRMKLAIVRHQNALPEEISWTNETSLGDTLSTPKRGKGSGRGSDTE